MIKLRGGLEFLDGFVDLVLRVKSPAEQNVNGGGVGVQLQHGAELGQRALVILRSEATLGKNVAQFGVLP